MAHKDKNAASQQDEALVSSSGFGGFSGFGKKLKPNACFLGDRVLL